MGLVALHDAHKVHRDIKPSNVLVTDDGQVKILDFGLVTEASDPRDRRGELLVGTVDYMAPEQAVGSAVGAAADWYSVGVMLYEALTGQLPIQGTMAEVLAQKSALDPPPASTLASVPDDLDRLCADLLRLDPAARPDGAEILRRLSVSEIEDRPRAQAAFVGRAREIEALQAAFAAMRADARVVVLLHGESGVGKSAIVQHVATAWRGDSAVVLSGRCYERESVPYKAVDGVIDELARHLGKLPTSAVAGLARSRGLIGQVFPGDALIDLVAGRRGRRRRRSTPS